ncbi:unnamed protein product [Auanema sp. JU1783]|nr:unnamed protein product [Auanema sp. JU1783]
MNASTLGLPFIRRRDTHIDENALQHLLLNEGVWRRAFRADGRRNRSKCNTVVGYLQFIYEKSHLHYLFPILLLFAYSIIGGLIFWSIESSQEEVELYDKRTFIQNLKDKLLRNVLHIDTRLKEYNLAYQNNSYVRKLHYTGYRKYALNMLYKTVYWYTVSVFYLTEHESHKAMTLRPSNPETAWKQQFSNNFGRINALKNYTDQLALRCWEIGLEGAAKHWSEAGYRTKINQSIHDYEIAVGLNNVLTPVWTFWNAMFLAATTYTTIGYGNITAKTKLGKLAAMVYAVIGIPLFLMILHKLGRFFMMALEHIWDWIMRCAEYLCLVNSESRPKLSEEERISEMPLLLAIGVAFGWMFLCAAIFLLFEKDWDYFKSFYFFFCSLTTIGYGDVTPTNSEDMFIIFALILIGLSLVSMCINVIQVKLEKLFEELLLTLMEEYNSDPESNTLNSGKIGMMEMWRMWKRRKDRLRGLAPARDAAGKASQNLAKVLPFARLWDRHQLIEELHHRLRQKNRSTQTDPYPVYIPVYEEAWTETSDIDSCKSYDTGQNFLMLPENSMCMPSRCESRPVVVQAENSYISSSSLLPTSMSGNQSLPQSAPSQMSKISSLSTLSSRNTAYSTKSAPCPSPSRFPIDYDPHRRWTFVGSNRSQRGTPRGLVVNYMYMKNQSARRGSLVPTTEMRRLIAELDTRLQDCRYINTPGSSLIGSASSEASVFK